MPAQYCIFPSDIDSARQHMRGLSGPTTPAKTLPANGACWTYLPIFLVLSGCLPAVPPHLQKCSALPDRSIIIWCLCGHAPAVGDLIAISRSLRIPGSSCAALAQDSLVDAMEVACSNPSAHALADLHPTEHHHSHSCWDRAWYAHCL